MTGMGVGVGSSVGVGRIGVGVEVGVGVGEGVEVGVARDHAFLIAVHRLDELVDHVVADVRANAHQDRKSVV